LLLGCHALAASGLWLPNSDTPITIALGSTLTAARTGTGWILRGRVDDVPWGPVVPSFVAVAKTADKPVVAVIPASAAQLHTTTNLAGEPRSSAVFTDTVVGPDCVGQAEPDLLERLAARYAVARALQISAALDEVLSWTLTYVSERKQFGRPLAKLPTVQALLAQMAGESAVVSALVDAALIRDSAPTDEMMMLAAAAKIRGSDAARTVARAAHQLHGAIGYTLEHRLHTLTTRLWSWSSEAGGQAHWAAQLGGRLATADLWSVLAKPPRARPG
jgi:acyl-CoA dehydrogenase